jgi:hypothetical protein
VDWPFTRLLIFQLGFVIPQTSKGCFLLSSTVLEFDYEVFEKKVALALPL